MSLQSILGYGAGVVRVLLPRAAVGLEVLLRHVVLELAVRIGQRGARPDVDPPEGAPCIGLPDLDRSVAARRLVARRRRTAERNGGLEPPAALVEELVDGEGLAAGAQLVRLEKCGERRIRSVERRGDGARIGCAGSR